MGRAGHGHAGDGRTYRYPGEIYGRGAGLLATALIMWTAFASVPSLLLGYSRVPFAAAGDGNYFRAFAGFVYVLPMRPHFQKEVRLAFVLIAAGLAVYLLEGAGARRVAVRKCPRGGGGLVLLLV